MVNFFRLLDSDRHISFCPMNFVADTYIGCPHACRYCYAPSYTFRGKLDNVLQNFRNFKRRFKSESDFDKIKKAITLGYVKGTCAPEQEYLISNAIKHRHPLRIGSVSEPLGIPLESTYGDTYHILEILIENNYPFVICTKSPLIATPKYVNLLKSTKNVAVQISLISIDDNLLKYIESGPERATPSAKARIDTLRKLSGEGIFTTCRIQPLIPEVTERGMKDLIFKLAEIGVKHVIVEFLWFPIAHAREISNILKMALDAYCESDGTVGERLKLFNNDLYSLYTSFNDSVKDYGRLFYSKKRIAELMPKYAEMVSEANKEFNSDMTFGSGNEETSYLNVTPNCCGVDRLPDFSGYPKCIAQTMLKIAKEKGRASLGEMKEYYSPDMNRFEKLWKRKVDEKTYFFEERMFKLRAVEKHYSEIEYVYDEKAVPN